MSAISPTPAAVQMAIISEAAARPEASALARVAPWSRWLFRTALSTMAAAATATAAPM
jgi:hypothetical protein